MGCVYIRNNSLWLKFKDRDGRYRYIASGFKTGQEKQARATLRQIEIRMAEMIMGPTRSPGGEG